jgi:hypothetical protein
MHEYVLAYRLSDMWQRNLLQRGEEKDSQYKFEDAKGIFRCSDYTCPKSAEERQNLYYPITNPNNGEEIWPKRTRVWAYSKEEHQRNVEADLIYWGKDGKGKVPAFKRYKHMLRHGDGVVPNTWWTFDEVGHNDTAKKELMALLPEDARAFSTPKPTGLIERILRIATGPDDLVLDFFAGSGTTGHAVLKLNAEDGGNRRFILVSNAEATADAPEKNLCRDVCARRVRRVIEGFGDMPALGGDFAYLRCRRIAPGRLLDIEHAQVWTALQMIHRDTLAPFEPDGFSWAGDGESALAYVPRFSAAILSALRKAVAGCAAVTLYSWQPETLRQHIRAAHVQHEAIPESLARRFGLKG